MKIDKKIDTTCYVIGWCLIGALTIYLVIAERIGFKFTHFAMPCVLHELTGFYCPGCGGTRAVLAFFKGHFLDSFFYHPMVLYTALIGGWFMISQSVERIFGGKIKIGMHFRDIYLWIALALIAINFLVKNALLLIWHIDVLSII